jgi:peptidoglycan/xylan/chitin deacetylase (PgdA/CDA1 family)
MKGVTRLPFYFRRLAHFTTGKVACSRARMSGCAGRFVLCFHRVLPAPQAAEKRLHHSMWISPAAFEKLLAWVCDIGIPVSLDEATDFSIGFAKPAFAFTFDDGWRDNLTYAVPSLVRHKVPATFFLVTKALSTGELFWADSFVEKLHKMRGARSELIKWGRGNLNASPPALSGSMSIVNFYLEIFKRFPSEKRFDLLQTLYKDLELDPLPATGEIVNWDDARLLSSLGFSIQSHSHTHEIFSVAPEEMLLNELVTSKNLIESEIGQKCTHFCFPNGRYLSDNERLLQAAGYSKAFKIDNRPVVHEDNPYFIPRYLVAERYTRLGWLEAELAGLVFR